MMTFAAPLPQAPGFDELQVGSPAPRVPYGLTVVEKGEANYASAEGEIPYALTPGATCTYADLNGPNGLFATLDFSDDAPIFYAGKEVSLAELQPDGSAAPPKREKTVAVTHLSCPHCGGALELRAPDQSERVGCPYCGSLLDCSSGNLNLLHALKGNFEKPLIPLGSVAEFEGQKLTVIGFLVRSCVIEGVKYYWREYLLYKAELGFRWLVVSDGHWTFVRNANAGEVRASGKDVLYHGTTFRRFQDAEAKVELVLGEFYWRIETGETVATSDFIAPPQILSCERTNYRDGKGGEISWSLGQYLPAEEIRAKFKVDKLPAQSSAGACQPNPHNGYLLPWLGMMAAAIIVAIVLWIAKPGQTVFSAQQVFQPLPAEKTGTPAEAGQVLVTPPFDLKAHYLVRVAANTTVDNAWLTLQGDLINEATGEVHPFDIDVEYYHGYEDGESWSEGSQSNEAFLSGVSDGKYTLRLEGFWANMKQPMPFKLEITQQASRPLHFMVLLFALSLVPIISLVRHFLFERARWNSDD